MELKIFLVTVKGLREKKTKDRRTVTEVDGEV